jgi:hypothetical protein
MTPNLTVALALCLFGGFLAGLGVFLSGLARVSTKIHLSNPLLQPPTFRTLMAVVPVIFLGLLALLFIGLKLVSAITWSWWWVVSPLWIPAAVFFTIALGSGLVLLVYKLFSRT